jgi:ferredoxin
MSFLRYAALSIVGALFRFFPWPCKTGLVELGRPDRDSPVLVTCNYRLTVERVRRALRGVNAYLLVANSRGINVWCAATGGLLTDHDVLSALKTTGIEDRVDHRRVILPQLAATGVEGRVVEKKSGWRVVWGPVYAKDIPEFLHGRTAEGGKLREVRFPCTQRLEMAAAWAFPVSLIVGLVLAVLWREAVLPGELLVWGLCIFTYLAFPLSEPWLGGGARGGLRVLGVLAAVWLALMAGVFVPISVFGSVEWVSILRWGLLSLVVLLILGVDFLGSTPIYKSGLQEDRLLKVLLDQGRCRGIGYCEDVCPRRCYDVDREDRRASMPRAEKCVQCGACIVQCPCDALSFETPTGGIIPPETIRRFKLNLMGKRVERLED